MNCSRTTGSRWIATLVSAVLALGTMEATAQIASNPPGAITTLEWKRVVRLSDGRTFVSDGAMALDATLAKPAVPSGSTLGEASGQAIERYLNAPAKNEFALSELRIGPTPSLYVAPSGIAMSSVYVDYMRRNLPGRLRLRTHGPMEPVVGVLDGKPVVLVMPVHQ